MKLLICALEPSADALGAALMASLKNRDATIQFMGCGGPLMAAAGLDSLFDIDPFSVIGPTAALRVLPAALRAADALANAAAVLNPSAAVFIDSWSFSRIAAQKFRRQAPDVQRYKYVAPQVWASRPERAKLAAELFDGILCLFEFELEMFEKEGARVRFVGHSGYQAAQNHRADPHAFRLKHNFGSAPLLAVLPGSRKAEVQRHAAPFKDTIRRLVSDLPGLRVVIPAAPAVEAMLPAVIADWMGQPVLIDSKERYDAFAAADAALAASGTVVGELAILNTPMIVVYRIDWLTEIWARRVLTTKVVSLVNIAAGREVVPEFLQRDCEPEGMAAALLPLLRGGPERDAQLEAFPAIVGDWTGGDALASDLAAEALLEWLKDGKTR